MGLFQQLKQTFLADKASKRIRTNLGQEIGRSGTEISGGYISDDDNSDFNNTQQIAIYDKMLRTDGMVKAAIDAMRLPILATERRILPPTDDPDDTKGMAAFTQEAMFERLDFDKFLLEALNYPAYGFYYFEKIFGLVDGKIFWKKWAGRVPTAHEAWEMHSDPKTPGVTQQLPSNDYPGFKDTENLTPEIPMSKLILFIHQQTGDNYEGISALRPAYKHWYIKDNLYRIQTIKQERGAGILIIKLPKGSSEDDIDKAEDLAENFRLNEKSYIVCPNPDWEIEILGVGGGGGKDSVSGNDLVTHHNRMIAMSVLAQFLELGGGDTGSYSLSKDQSSFFTLGLRAVADNVASVINEQAIKELVDLNFGPKKYYPKLEFAEVGDIDFKETAEALEKLANSGFVVVNDNVKKWAHDQYKLPKLTDKELEEMKQQEAEAQKKQEEKEKRAEDLKREVMKQSNKEPDDVDKDVKEVLKKEEPKKPKEPSVKKKRLAEERLFDYKSFRPLTFAEKRVNFAEQKKQWDAQENEVRVLLSEYTAKQKDALFKQIESAMKNEDVKAVKDLTASLSTQAKKDLTNQVKKSYEYGQTEAADEISTTPPATSDNALIETQVDNIVEERNNKITTEVKKSVTNSLATGIGAAAALFAASQIFDKAANVTNEAIATTVIGEAFNMGRNSTFTSASGGIYAMQRSEILDSATCNVCMSIDGRVVDKKDPFSQLGLVHSRCRGTWVAILQTDEDLPKVTGVPKSIKSRFEVVEGVPQANAFKQLKNPNITKSSRAQQKIDDGKIEQ